MPATLQVPRSLPDPGQENGAFASGPLILLVFGFVLLVLLQAWFVRRLTQLSTRYKERRSRSHRLAAEAAELAEEVSGLDRAHESSTASIAGLERETQVLQQRIEAFAAEHPEAAAATAAATAGDHGPPDPQGAGEPASGHAP